MRNRIKEFMDDDGSLISLLLIMVLWMLISTIGCTAGCVKDARNNVRIELLEKK